ncbi:hypothetical protein QTI66_23720 [Variovorax sp. J22R133]|uniref:hypothetical protein n=1 Tax=Variovorax brevis TaxID=3053503 RepID=UPI0025757E5C|nr:hypothetical protein [Variovorax sp. J22R133]MDM0115179.1 hypothetical protein [Variovorax sp. J22R133]
MRNGIYEAHFTTDQGILGTGAVLISNGTVFGADALQFFKGQIHQSGTELSVTMDLTRHSLIDESAFGTDPVVHLEWHGEAVGDIAFKLSCKPKGVNVAIYVSGQLLKAHD